MKQMKKTISLLLTVAMLFSLCVIGVSAYNTGTVAVIDSTEYTDLGTALNAAAPGDEVKLVDNFVLTTDLIVPSGVSLTIEPNVQLTVPTGAGNDTLTGNNTHGSAPTGLGVARKLTVESGATVTVEGTLLVAGNQQSTQPESGCLTGTFGKIDLSGDIVVSSGGKLYARGIIEGDGLVTAENGAQVYQLFQIKDWRGGTATQQAYSAGVFPFSRYELTNITANAVYYKGSTLYAQYYIYASNVGRMGAVTIIGSGGLLQFASDSTEDDVIATEYDASSDTLTATVYGSATTGYISVSFRLIFFDYVVTSAGLVLPFGYNMDVVVDEDSSLEVTDDMKLLPGCDLTNYGTLTVDSGVSLYVYDKDSYLPSYSYNSNWTPTEDATLNNYGTVTNNGVIASSGRNATEDGFTNIVGITYGGGTTSVDEYIQSSGVDTVTFYKAQ